MKKPGAMANMCTMRDGSTCASAGLGPPHQKCALNWTAAESPAWCPNGWVPAPSYAGPTVPIPPPDVSCPGLAHGELCIFKNDSAYLVGGTFLFDVVADFAEKYDVAAANPEVVADLLAALQKYNNSHCNGTHCVPDQDTSRRPRGTPTTEGGLAVWLPWDGDPTPSACDTNRSVGRPPAPDIPGGADTGSFKLSFRREDCLAAGWAAKASPKFSGPALFVQVLVDGKPASGPPRPAALPRETAGPHGFDISFTCGGAAGGQHTVTVAARRNATGAVTWSEDQCTAGGRVVACGGHTLTSQ